MDVFPLWHFQLRQMVGVEIQLCMDSLGTLSNLNGHLLLFLIHLAFVAGVETRLNVGSLRRFHILPLLQNALSRFSLI